MFQIFGNYHPFQLRHTGSKVHLEAAMFDEGHVPGCDAHQHGWL